MKIKKITPTSEYKEIAFGFIKDEWSNSSVLTPSGFEKIKAFEFIKSGKSIKIDTCFGTLKCDPGHILLTTNGPRFAKDLQNNDKLIGYNGNEVLFNKSDGPIEDFYDIEISDPHWYYTSGVVSHNTLMLCNNAVNCVLQGLDVLFVTFELSTLKTAIRMAGAFTNIPTKKFIPGSGVVVDDEYRKAQSQVKRTIDSRSACGAQIAIYDLPSDECSVDDIAAIIDTNHKLYGWRPKVVCLDYLELMVSRHKNYNDDQYYRQKSVSTEVRGLAKKENVFVISATQTNRSGSDTGRNTEDAGHINLNKQAESFGKSMPVDYVVSLNQTLDEYQGSPKRIRLWVAKNRNGEKFVEINTIVDYDTMRIEQDV